MEEELIKVMPNKEKAKLIFKMAETTLEMVKTIDKTKFPSNLAKEYYDAIRELISIVLLLDGYKAIGESAHKKQISYLEANYKEFNKDEIILLDDLRITRNRISYDGFFVKEDYINRKIGGLHKIIEKLKEIINKKLI